MIDDDERTPDPEFIREALQAAVSGPFFPEPWFQTIFGVERDAMAEVLRTWPRFETTETTRLAINNALVHFGTNPYGVSGDWSEFTESSPAQAKAALERWRRSWLDCPDPDH